MKWFINYFTDSISIFCKPVCYITCRNIIYRIYFYAYTQPTELSAYDDTVVFPKQYTSVLLAKARYYIHQFKDNMSQAQLADVEFQNGLRTMREQLLEPFPVIMDDRRSFYV